MSTADEDLAGLAALHRIAVDAQDAGIRKLLLQPALEALRAAPEGMDVLIAAGRTGFRNAIFEAAVMAAQAPGGENTVVGAGASDIGRSGVAFSMVLVLRRSPATSSAGEEAKLVGADRGDVAHDGAFRHSAAQVGLIENGRVHEDLDGLLEGAPLR